MARRKIPKQVKQIVVDMYHTSVYVARTREDFDLLAKAFGLELDTRGLGGGVRWIERVEDGAGLALCGFFEKEIQPSTVAHEMLHATLFIADYVGVKRDDDEALCYLHGYLVEKVHEFLWQN